MVDAVTVLRRRARAAARRLRPGPAAGPADPASTDGDTGTGAATDPPEHLRHATALLIGTGAHDNSSERPPDIPQVEATVRDLARELHERCGLAEPTVLLDRTSTELASAVLNAIDAARGPLILYFVGHGGVDRHGELLLFGTNTDPRPGWRDGTALSYALVRDSLRKQKDRHPYLVILDCCFSGRAGLSASDDLAKDLATVAKVEGGYVLASAGRDEQALVREEEEHTVFTGDLIRLLRDGDPRLPEHITVDGVYRHLKDLPRPRGVPSPHSMQDGNVGDLVLMRNPAYRESPATACPYKGLNPFEEEDGERFFGRRQLTGELVARLQKRYSEARPLVVTGVSGSGKTSLLRAGLLPAIGAGALGIEGSADWPRVLFTPTASPCDALAGALVRMGWGGDPVELTRQITDDPARFAEELHRLRGKRGAACAVLVVDQIEEAFTDGDQDDHDAFFTALAGAATGGGEGRAAALVVQGVRFDFLPRLTDPADGDYLYVGPMSAEELRDAIERPAWEAGLDLQLGLTDTLLHDLGGTAGGASFTYEPGRLPLLSHALMAMWHEWHLRPDRGRMLTSADYARIGRLHGGIGATADRVLEHLRDEEERIMARQLLVRLVRLGEGREDSRQRVEKATLLDATSEPARAARVLDAFAASDARLVTLGETVEITHEALLRHWSTLGDWLKQGRESLQVEQQLNDQVRRWEEAGRDPSFLIGGTLLALAREAAGGDGGSRGIRNPAVRAFLQASERRQRRETGFRRVAVVLAAVFLAASGLAFANARAASGEREAADRERRAATARGLLFQAATLRDTQPAVALRLALAAHEIDPDTRAGLQTTLLSTRYAGSLTERGGTAGTVNAAAVSPAGRHVLTADVKDGATLWSFTEQPPSRLAALAGPDTHTGPVRAMAFSPDGRLALTGASDDQTILWDLGDGAAPPTVRTRLIGHSETVTGVAFVPDPLRALTSSEDGTVRLWDLATGTSVPLLEREDAGIMSVAAEDSGRLVLSGAGDGTVTLWDLAAGPEARIDLQATDRPGPSAPHDQRVASVAVGRAGDRVLGATASYDGTAVLWELHDAGGGSRPSATLLARVGGHADKLTAVALNPDGRQLVTAGNDRTAVVWDLDDPRQPQREATLSGHTDAVQAVSYLPGGRQVLTAGDKTTLLWDTADRSRLAPSGSVGLPHDVFAVALDRGGRRAITGTNDGTAALIDLTEPARPRRLPAVLQGHTGKINAVAFSPAGDRAVTASDDDTARVWDTRGTSESNERAVLHHDDSVVSAAFLGDENHIVTGSHDRSVRLWDVSGPRPREVGRLDGFKNSVRALAASENGRTILTGSDDGTATLWDVSQPSDPTRTDLINGGDPIGAVALTPLSDRGVTADRSGRAVLWDLTDRARPRRLGTIEGHTGAILAVNLSSDGSKAVTASEDFTTVLWDLHDRTRPERLTALTGPDRPLVRGVALNAGGQLLLGAGADRTVSVWDLAPASALADSHATACRIVGRGLNPDEWARFVIDLPFRDTCP